MEKDDSRDSEKIKEREYQQNLQFIPYITIIRNFSAFLDRCFPIVFLWLLFQPICIFFFSLQKSTFAHGFSRIPGLNGIPVVNLADAFETLYTGQFTLSVQLIKPNNPVIPLTDAVPQLQTDYPL